MVRMHQGGVRQVEISELFKCDLKNSYIRFTQTETALRRPDSGSERVTTPREDRFLIIQARKQPFPTARQHIMHNMHNIVNATGLEYQMKQ
jgi:hypothetical protein